MSFELKNILQCPVCLNLELVFEEKRISCQKCSSVFEIEDGVPVLLTENTTISHQAEIHKTAGTTFDYIGHYQRDAIEYDYFQEQTGAIKHNERRVREFIALKVPKEKGLILDVGCGSAWVAKKFCPRGHNVISFDISLKNTSEALLRFPFENHAAIAGDVFSLPFRDNTFDIIIASEIIEHLTEPRKFIHNLTKILKPGGTLIITTPYKEKIIYSLCVHCNKPTPQSAHLHSFDEKIIFSLIDGEPLVNGKFFKFGNKALIYLRTHIFLRFLGFWVWRIIDGFANLIYNRPISILAEWEKSAD